MNDQRPVRAEVAVARSAVARSLSSLLYAGYCNTHCRETQTAAAGERQPSGSSCLKPWQFLPIPHGGPHNQAGEHSLVVGSVDASCVSEQSPSPHGLAPSQVASSNPSDCKRVMSVDLCLFPELYSSILFPRKDATSNDTYKRKRWTR